MDVGGRLKANIKGERSKPKEEGGKKAKKQSLSVRVEEKDFLDKHGSPLCDYHERHDQPLPGDQGLTFQPILYKFYCLGF